MLVHVVVVLCNDDFRSLSVLVSSACRCMGRATAHTHGATGARHTHTHTHAASVRARACIKAL